MPYLRLAMIPLVLFATPALADQPSTQSAPPAAEKKLCRSIATIGSNMRKRVCHTKSEWAQIDGTNGSNAESAIEHRRNSGGLNTGI